jgi:hypothetical protein
MDDRFDFLRKQLATQATEGIHMKYGIAILSTALLLTTASFAQSPGTSAGASAGGSSASGGDAASSTTVGSSMNGSTTGNKGPREGLKPANSTNTGTPHSNAVGSSATVPGADGMARQGHTSSGR